MIITLTTDFGLSDPFVGIMKGVILGIAPDARLVDITHDIHSYDILEAAFILESSYRYFPANTVHLVVVDPGVGSARRPIAAAANGHKFVAPDNGVLSFVLETGPEGASPSTYHLTNASLFLNSISRTFHGRDIFAPAAAHLARGAAIDRVGPPISDATKRPWPQIRQDGAKTIAAVLRIDKFGNIITNIRPERLPTDFRICVGDVLITRLCSSYSESKPGEIFAIEGSTGFVELALNQGSASELLKVRPGSEIEVESGSTNQ